MKKIINFCSIIAVCTLLGFSTSAQAQQKIAHVDTDATIVEMNEYKSAKSEVESYSQALQKVLEEEQTKVQEYYTEVMKQIKAGTLPPVKQKEAEAKLAEMQEDLQKQAADADRKLAEKEQKLTEPLYEKFNAAVKKVAEANGFAYIFDKKLALYSGGGIDATALIKAELGIE